MANKANTSNVINIRPAKSTLLFAMFNQRCHKEKDLTCYICKVFHKSENYKHAAFTEIRDSKHTNTLHIKYHFKT